ncbi:MAG: thymidylate synthase [Candidatus Vogelbacteria bacterium]|nr:thymidylate synthase [Candidatus Vogelbacteria bacterium]
MEIIGAKTPDTQYRDILRSVIENGVRVPSQQGIDCLRKVGVNMHFDLANGFPMITERNLNPVSAKIPPWKQAIGEICAFINGARTQEELEKFGCLWWRKWVTAEKCAKRGLPPGDLGDGSYGDVFANFPTKDGGTWNQFQHILEQLREFPHLRTHFITPWEPDCIIRGKGKKQRVVVAPCHGWIHFLTSPETLTVHMIQRSADLVLGVPNNMVQYSALALAVGHLLGYPNIHYVHSMSDAHIYIDHVDAVELMLDREPRCFPDINLTEEGKGIGSIFDLRAKHFELEDYNPHPGIKNLTAAI